MIDTMTPRVGKPASDIAALTGLRGFAATMVVLYHYSAAASSPLGWVKGTLGRGYLWVDLFFVLSGYLMALNYGKMFANGFSRAAFAGFLMRRLARIYPLYFVLLSLQVLWTLAAQGQFHETGAWGAVVAPLPARDIPANFLLIQSIGVAPSLITQAWSISTEFAAYLLFPVFVTVVLTGAWRSALVSGLAAMALLCAAAVSALHDGAWHSGPLDIYDGTRLAPVLRCLGGFLFGMLSFRLGSVGAVSAVAARDVAGLTALGILLAMLAAGAPDLAVVALFPALVLCLSRNDGVPAALFANPAMLALGAWSYAMYLLHPLLQQPRDLLVDRLRSHLPGEAASVIASLAVLAVLLLLSWGAYHRIEVSGRRAVQRLAGLIVRDGSRRPQDRSVAAGAGGD
jgi:peptidoglycan/LPS O-acetylase OafA/YrhL